MRVSVVIPVYNEADVIAECLKSLSEQRYGDFEIILVDDGSTDNTLSECQMSNVKCQIFKQKHKGAGAARNFGARHAKGEILVFVDADMTFEPDFIEKLVNPIIKGKTKGTFSKEEYVENWDNIWARCWNINQGWPDEKRHPKDYPDEDKVFRAILKSEFDKTGGFIPGGYTDDYSLYEKLGYKSEAAPEAKYYHKNPESLPAVFRQAIWVGKRPYKLGYLGYLVALVRTSFPISLAVGLAKSIVNLQPTFVLFKAVYDFGVFWGILSYVVYGKGSK